MNRILAHRGYSGDEGLHRQQCVAAPDTLGRSSRHDHDVRRVEMMTDEFLERLVGHELPHRRVQVRVNSRR
jgi:hypothetical protein